METTIVVTGTVENAIVPEIDHRSLHTHKVVDLAEILSDDLVEVQMIRKSGYGNEVSVRGFSQENMKVMLDGGILEGSCGSRKDPGLSHVNLLTVGKLAVQQGPFDVSKPGCLGGSIDIVTKKPSPGFDGEVLGRAGSYGFYSGGFSTSGGSRRIQVLAGYNYSEAGQYKDGVGNRLWAVREGLSAPFNALGKAAKSFSKHDAWGKLQLMPNEKNTILLEHTYGNASNILVARAGMDTAEEITYLSKASWNIRELGQVSKSLTASFYRNQVDHNPFQSYRAVAAPKNNIVRSTITGGALQNVEQTSFANFTYGVDSYHREWWGDIYNSLNGALVNGYFIPTTQDQNNGEYVQMDKAFKKWNLGVGLRHDRFAQQADESLPFSKIITANNHRINHMFSGHLSAKYSLSEHGLLFGGVGRSNRTPTGIERYVQSSATYFGNPDLPPTANNELDLGYKFERGPWRIQAKGFHSFLDDYVYQEYNSGGYQTYKNIDARLWGGDVQSTYTLSKELTLEGGFAYQRGTKRTFTDNNQDKDLGRIPPLKARMALQYENLQPFGQKDGSLFGSLEAVHTNAARHVDTVMGEKELPDWRIVNLRAGYQYKRLNVNLGIDNLFDRNYAVANSYEWDVLSGSSSKAAIVNEPGRFVYLSAGFNW